MTVAPMRVANCRSASGGIASSFAATRYQEGSDLQAGAPITSAKAERRGPAARTSLSPWSGDVAGEVVDEVVF